MAQVHCLRNTMAFFTTRTQRLFVFTSLTRAVFSQHAMARVVEDVQQPSSIHSSYRSDPPVAAYINSSDGTSSRRRREHWPSPTCQPNLPHVCRLHRRLRPRQADCPRLPFEPSSRRGASRGNEEYPSLETVGLDNSAAQESMGGVSSYSRGRLWR